MIFFCGVLFPAASLPLPLKAAAYVLPLPNAGEIFRHSLISPGGPFSAWPGILLLAGFSLLFFEGAAILFGKRSLE